MACKAKNGNWRILLAPGTWQSCISCPCLSYITCHHYQSKLEDRLEGGILHQYLWKWDRDCHKAKSPHFPKGKGLEGFLGRWVKMSMLGRASCSYSGFWLNLSCKGLLWRLFYIRPTPYVPINTPIFGGKVVGKGSGSHYNCPSLEVQILGGGMGAEEGGKLQSSYKRNF